MNAITEEELIDYLAGELPPARHAEVADALAQDDALRDELAELETVVGQLSRWPDPGPSPRADEQFAALLRKAEREQTLFPAKAATNLRPAYRKPWLRFAAVAAAVLLVFTAGRYYEGGYPSETDRELAATRTLMLELMTDRRTSVRIRATTVTLELPEADPVTTANLGYLLRQDENPNVRLAALDALRRFPEDPLVRDELVAALGETPPEVVRLELIETLVQLDETRILPHLRDIIETDSLPRPLRSAAEMAAFKLI